MPPTQGPNNAPACKTCPRCGPTTRRCDTGNAIVLIGLLVGTMCGVGQAFWSLKAGPQPAGLYVAALGAAVTGLWVVARAFRGHHC